MPLSFQFILRRRREAALVLALGAAAMALACGPDFPNRYLDAPDAEILAAPEATFSEEVTRIAATLPAPLRAVPTTRAEIVATDLNELEDALHAAGRTEAEVEAVIARYAHVRSDLETHGEVSSENGDNWTPDVDVPAEFFLYLRGAKDWHAGRWQLARSQWSALLELPEPERRHRTTWADFMIGRTWERDIQNTYGDMRATAADQARSWFRRARVDAGSEFPDSLGLAVASLGREARVELLMGNPRGAIALYAAQLAAGDTAAVNSLLFAARAAIAPGGVDFGELANDPVARGIVTSLFLARATGTEGNAGAQEKATLEKWALALRGADVRNAEQADRLAWLAYRAGQFSMVEQWLALAPADAPLADWIRAKLALRAGDLTQAEALLTSATKAGRLSTPQRALALAELGRTRLALDDHTGALTAWLDGGHWEDAAYLGEQVLTRDELRGYVEVHCPVDGDDGQETDGREADPVKIPGYLRSLCARRLVREGHADIAAEFFPEPLRGPLSAYIEASRTGFDVSRTVDARAAAFWRAAQIVREHGLALWATELDPDWAIFGANFDRGAAATDRLRTTVDFGPTFDERERLEKKPAAKTRFSYRYRAADLAWWAASLLPNDSDETARILVEAGGWLKQRDPHAAERFYQALVIRCGNTAPGRSAAEMHWFPVLVEKETVAVTSENP